MTTDRWRDFDTWLKSLEAHGLPAPPRSLIAEVVGTGTVPPRQHHNLEPWLDDITALLLRTDPGRVDTPDREDLGMSEDEMASLLLEWRDEQVANGSLARRDLPDAALKSVIKFRDRPLSDMTSRVPPNAFDRLPEMRRVIGVTSSAAPDEPPAPTATTSHQPVEERATETPAAAAATPGPAASGVGDSFEEPDPPAHGSPSEHRAGTAGSASISGWAPYQGAPPSSDLPSVHVVWGDAGELRLRWAPSAVDSPVVVYRVVCDDLYLPYEPDVGREVAVTSSLECIDAEPMTSPIRYVSVWAYCGDDAADAAAHEPTPVGVATVVARPVDVRIREDNGQVVGSWSVQLQDSQGARRVERVAIQRSEAGSARPTEVASGEANLRGFVDAAVLPGRLYTYRLTVHAIDNRQIRHQSGELRYPVQTDAPLVAVGDLVAHVARPQESIDLEWTSPPAGEVRIYRHGSELRGGVTHGDHPVEVLDQMGLTDDLWCFQPTEPSDASPDRNAMRGLGWPPGWQRVYFTPVTVLAGRAVVGPSASTAGVAAVSKPRLVERVAEVVITFGWPDGASGVHVHLAPAHADASAVVAGTPYRTIDVEQYRRLGGLRLKLPAEGARVFLTAHVYDQGRTIAGPSAHVDYLGLDRLQYSVAIQRRRLLGKPGAVTVKVARIASTSRAAAAPSPWFVLTHNAKRLPLHPGDGDVLPVAPKDDPSARPSPRFRPESLEAGVGQEEFRAELGDRQEGYVRLFLSEDAAVRARAALLDPPLTQLKISR